VDLRGQPFDAEPLQIHVFGLEHPGGAGLIKQRPEDGDHQIDRAQPQNGQQAVAAENLFQERKPAGGYMDIGVAAQPEHQGGNRHQHARHTKGHVRPIPFKEPGREDRGEGRAEVDREVEPLIDLFHQVLISRAKLVAHVCRDTRLNTT